MATVKTEGAPESFSDLEGLLKDHHKIKVAGMGTPLHQG